MSNANTAASVLLVDDDDTTRKSLAELLENAGYTVTKAGDIEEALDLLAKPELHLAFVLLDQTLGTVENGTKAAQKIAEFAPDVLIVMYTADGHIDDHQQWRAMQAGVHRYMKKANAAALLRDFEELIEDMTELRELTNMFAEFTATRVEVASALFGLDVGVALIDREYRVWFANKYMSEIYSLPNMVGAPCWTVFHGHPVEQGPCSGCLVSEAIKAEETQAGDIFSFDGISDFSVGEFKDGLTIERLCLALSNDEPSPGAMSNNTVEWLNEFLKLPHLLEKITTKMEGKPPSERIKSFKENHNKSASLFDLKILNRSLLEEYYPQITPMSRMPKKDWLRVQITPIKGKQGGKVIAARVAVQKLGPAVRTMDRATRLHLIAQGIVRAGYGRARIFEVRNQETLEFVTAAAAPDESTGREYHNKVAGYKTSIQQHLFLMRAKQEMEGTLKGDFESLPGDLSHIDWVEQMGLQAPWIDLPVWHEKDLIAWLQVDIVGGKKSELFAEDILLLWHCSEEIMLAFNDSSKFIELRGLHAKIAAAEFKIGSAQNTDEALEEILKGILDILPCYEVRIRVLENDKLRLLKREGDEPTVVPPTVNAKHPDSKSSYVVKTLHPLYVKDDKEYQQRIALGESLPRGISIRPGPSMANLPLAIEGQCFGVLYLDPIGTVNWDDPNLKRALEGFSSRATLLVRDMVMTQKLAEGKAAAERELMQAFGAIHGIKGPLTAIRNHLLALIWSADRGELTPDMAKQDATSALRSLDRIGRLANRLMRLSRNRQGATQETGTLLLLSTCQDEAKDIHPKLNIEIAVSDDAQVLYVEPEEFRAMIDELILNAARATKETGQVKIAAVADRDCVKITVEDDGPGVEVDQLERIFDRWYYNFGGGTGLGLSMVKKVVEELGGSTFAELCRPGLRIVMHIPKKPIRHIEIQQFT